MFYSDFFPLLFWNLSQAVPARECVCIPVVLLNQTGLQHSILFLDSRLPFLSCKKYSSASGWQAISFYKCVRPRFFHLSLPPSPFMPCCIQSFWGERERGADFNSCTGFFNSQIFSVTRFIHLLCLAAYAASLIVCNGWTARVDRAGGVGGGDGSGAPLIPSPRAPKMHGCGRGSAAEKYPEPLCEALYQE